MNLNELRSKSPIDLITCADSLGIENSYNLKRQELIKAILKKEVKIDDAILAEGVLDVTTDGFGFIRYKDSNYLPASDDIYVSISQIRRHGLRTGDTIYGEVKVPRDGERFFALSKLILVNGEDIEKLRHRIHFDNLTPLYPNSKINLELLHNKNEANTTLRVIDIVAPIGKGQRALIVAPPRTGKTVMLKNIANAITSNHPEVTFIVLLIDERPEEVTDMSRSVKGEVISSTFDESYDRHVRVSEIVIEKAKRLVEHGHDVFILLDSITRLGRAYNNFIPSSGKVLTGGVDSNALQYPKRFFGAARNIEEGGSLTIIATALVETGSKMDEVIFEEFKGTGNCEIVLDRKIAEKRLFPSIDILKSGTRKEELLVSKDHLQKTWILRRYLSSLNASDALDFMLSNINSSSNNEQFFKHMNNKN